MEIFNSIEAALEAYPNSYIAFEKMGDCMICGERKDLRCGACFQCSSQIAGEKIKGGHRLWDSKNPDNTWYVGELRGLSQ